MFHNFNFPLMLKTIHLNVLYSVNMEIKWKIKLPRLEGTLKLLVRWNYIYIPKLINKGNAFTDTKIQTNDHALLIAIDYYFLFQVKPSLGALSKKKILGIELDWRVTRNVGSSHCYLDRRPLYEIDEIVYEYNRKKNRLIYVALSRGIFNTLFNIIRVYRSRYVL